MEEVPLIAREGTLTAPMRPSVSRRSRRTAKFVVDMNDSDDEEDLELDRLERRSKWRRRLVQLWPLQLLVLLVEHAQFMALLLSMSQTWAWPKDFISALKFLFWTNLDVWEYFKVSDSSVYKGVKDAIIPSGDVAVKYEALVIGWFAGLGGILLLLLVYYVVIRWRWPSKAIPVTAKVQFVFLLATQLLALPIGVTMARLAQCRSSTLYFPDGRVRGTEKILDVINDVVCLTGKHWSLAGPALCFLALLFLVVPVKLCLLVSDQLVSSDGKRHEAYVRLKEAEYAQSLDETWLLGQWHVFAAFKRAAVFSLPITFWLKLIVCVALALPHDRRETWKVVQASICVAAFGLMLFVNTVIWRGACRVRALSLIQMISLFVLLCNSLVGALLAANVQDPLLTEKYLLSGLITINATGLGLFICVIGYLVWHWWKERSGRGASVWPSLVWQRKMNRTDGHRSQVDGRTARYLLAILRARQTLAMNASCPAVLAPTHDLARHIHIINAYCREAEQEQDELHATLWDVLDDLMTAHTASLKKSIFADSSKVSVRYSAQELYELLPTFSYRLAQRERDFILMSPLKRRILLKLYILSTFMRSHLLRTPQASARRRSTHQRGIQRKSVAFAIEDVWQASISPSAVDLTRTQSQVSSITDEDEGVHERFLQQIDSWLPERIRSRSSTAGSQHHLPTTSSQMTRSTTPDLFEQKLDQQFPDVKDGQEKVADVGQDVHGTHL